MKNKSIIFCYIKIRLYLWNVLETEILLTTKTLNSMEKFKVKPRSVGFKRLNNGKFISFMHVVHTLAKPLDAVHLGIEDLLSDFNANELKMRNATGRKSALVQTQAIHRLGKVRIAAYQLLRNLVFSYRFSADEEEMESYKKLRHVLAPYAKTPKHTQETISGDLLSLVSALRKEDMLPYVEKLCLTERVDEIEKANRVFIDKYAERQAVREKNALSSSKVIRPKLKELYEELMSIIYANSLVNPSEELTAFILNHNAYVDEMIVNKNISDGMREASKKRQEESRNAANEAAAGLAMLEAPATSAETVETETAEVSQAAEPYAAEAPYSEAGTDVHKMMPVVIETDVGSKGNEVKIDSVLLNQFRLRGRSPSLVSSDN